MQGPLVKLVITLACHAGIRSSSLLGTANLGVVQSGRTLALGASGRRFKSCRRDHLRELCIKVVNNGEEWCMPLEPFRI